MLSYLLEIFMLFWNDKIRTSVEMKYGNIEIIIGFLEREICGNQAQILISSNRYVLAETRSA